MRRQQKTSNGDPNVSWDGMVCPDCQKKMVRRCRQYVAIWQGVRQWQPEYWWCACGREVEMNRVQGKTEEEYAMNHWRLLNGEEMGYERSETCSQEKGSSNE